MGFKLVTSMFSIAILIAFVSQGSGKKLSSGARIIDPGDNSTIVQPPHSQPWVVGVVFNNKPDDDCSGTLISKKYVITSAHCNQVTHVVVGDHNQNVADGEERIKVINQVTYPYYYPDRNFESFGYDLRILELEREVHTKFAKPALLPKENEMFSDYIVSGFGFKAPGVDSQFLRTVNLTDLGWSKSCSRLWKHGTPEKQICGENPKDISLGPCNGDSGGPWVVKNERGDAILAGVHFMGLCKDDEIPHMAVRVSNPEFLRWIKKVTGL